MGYFESLDSNLELEPTPIGVSFSTLEYTHDSFLDNIKNNVFSPTKIKSIIENNISLYFEYNGFSDPKTRENMQGIWTNIGFLTNVLALLNENPKFRQKIIIAYQKDINIIASDYLSATKDEGNFLKNSEVAKILYEIACNVNAEYIVQLSSNVPVSFAKNICLAYFSTFNINHAKYAMIDMIWNYAITNEVLTIEQIIYIFYVFFKDNFADLFSSVMLYRYSDYPESEENKRVKQVDDNISSALINILNSMSSVQIREVLAKYANKISFIGGDLYYVRFSLKHLPAAFKNIAIAVADAEQSEYYLP